uniref:Uncharacterized protein n=1 Tax=Rhizophora mucronata TaxID=61149 RepID=A0A2P2PHF9_RHIMU
MQRGWFIVLYIIFDLTDSSKELLF